MVNDRGAVGNRLDHTTDDFSGIYLKSSVGEKFMHWIALVALLALVEYMAFVFLVAAARGRYKVAAPAMTGHPVFERTLRVQANTLELLVVYLPALWLFGLFFSPQWGAGIGALFLLGRALYAWGYIRAAEKRELGAMLSFASLGLLLLGAGAGILRMLTLVLKGNGG
jgi:uncharacterized membrane protein YecN with MAPEG domain